MTDIPLYLFYPDVSISAVTSPMTELSTAPVTALAPADKSIIHIHNDLQRWYLQQPREKRIPFYQDQESRDYLATATCTPPSMTLKWSTPLPDTKKTTVMIAEHPDFQPAIAAVPSAETPCELVLRNLKAATTYYWKVIVSDGQSDMASPTFSFTTEDMTPRLVGIQGVPNYRDVGGRIGRDGRRIRQGMIYRSAGLNNNAKAVCMPVEKVLETHPDIKNEHDRITTILNGLQAELDSRPSVDYLPYALHDSWTLFRPSCDPSPEQISDFFQLDDIPETFLGAEARIIQPDGRGKMILGDVNLSQAAFVMQVFHSNDEGFMRIGCGADWFWQLAVNNAIVADYLKTGNGIAPSSIENHVIDIPVKKGKNILAFMIRSGSVEWTLCCARPVQETTREDYLTSQIQNRNKQLMLTDRIVDYYMPGDARLSKDMKTYMLQHLGIRTDLDLRSVGECNGMTESPLGTSVQWFRHSSAAYSAFGSSKGREAFCSVFRYFLDEANYPITFHCISGQDRTGAVSFVINALLGAKEEELYLDWESTGFWNHDANLCHKNHLNHLFEVFARFPGDTINEQVENFVYDCGFRPEDVEKLRSILLE